MNVTNTELNRWIRDNQDKLEDDPDDISAYLLSADQSIRDYLAALGLRCDGETWVLPDRMMIGMMKALPGILSLEADYNAPKIMSEELSVEIQDDQGDYNIAYIEILLDVLEAYLA